MRNKVHVKTGDLVYLLTGKDKGKRGKVIKVFPDKGRVTVENVNIVKRHTKPRKADQQGGIIEKEAPIHSSNVMLVCPRCDKPTKVGKQILENGQKVRVCKKCKEVIDVIKDVKNK